jgi:hypothetical protein
VQAVKVKLGLSQDDMTEITSGLNERSKVIAKDIAGLKAGEPVNVQGSAENPKIGQNAVKPAKS